MIAELGNLKLTTSFWVTATAAPVAIAYFITAAPDPVLYPLAATAAIFLGCYVTQGTHRGPFMPFYNEIPRS